MPKMSIPRSAGQLPKPEGYPDTLDDYGITSHVIGATPGEADEEFILEFFRGSSAKLIYVPIEELRPGPKENNIRYPGREKSYSQMPLSTMPPLVIEHGEILDGNHRYRVAKSMNASGLWCYDIEEQY
mgnify:CR=1 FL=1